MSNPGCCVSDRIIPESVWRKLLRCVLATVILLTTTWGLSQQSNPPNNPPAVAPTPNQTSAPPQPQAGVVTLPDAPSTHAASQEVDPSKQQPKRILGIMPNYRAVSAAAIPPPPTPKEAFKIATQNSFDYSSFIFVGITSAIAEGNNAHPALGILVASASITGAASWIKPMATT